MRSDVDYLDLQTKFFGGLAIMVIGVVVAFGVGYLVGSSSRQVEIQSPWPTNYDPVKAQKEQLESCLKIASDQVAQLKQVSTNLDAFCKKQTEPEVSH